MDHQATGNLELARPICGLTNLRDYDPYISDLAALLTGVKPVIYLDFDDLGWPYIQNLCRRLKLKYLFPEAKYNKTGYHIPNNRKTAIFGFDAAKIREAARLWSLGVVGVPWGLALGYPECCVKAYTQWQQNAYSVEKYPDLIKLIAGRARPGEKLNFTLNNIYNYYSRIRNDQKDHEMFKEILARNAGIYFPTLTVISWHPCAYNCRKSAAAGAKMFHFMEYYLPEYARHVKKYLSRPVLFFDKYEFVTLEGKVSAGRLNYSGNPGPVSLAPYGWFKKIQSLSRPSKKPAIMSLNVKRLLSADWKIKPELLDFGS